MTLSPRPDSVPNQAQVAAGRLLHEIDRVVSRPGPLTGGDEFRRIVAERLGESLRDAADDPADYVKAFVQLANQHGWNLAPDGSNWDEQWREVQAAGRRRARWEEVRDALEDLD